MLGQLQDTRNVTTLAHYLDLLAGVGLVCGLQKFANQPFRQKGSSPKFVVFNNALMTTQLGRTFKEVRSDPEIWGRVVESAVGAHLLNITRGTQIEVFYWREGDKEVDFVLQRGNKIVALEVKSSQDSLSHTGIDLFVEKFHPHKVLLIGEQGIPFGDFFADSVLPQLDIFD